MEHLLVGLTIVIVLGIGAQWLAWRIRLPSILLLLLGGFIAGPITGLVHPDELFGDLLFPVVAVSVAIIMFEGGLTLRLSELPKAGKSIFRLISLGAAVTWAIATVAAHFLLALDWSLALLLGAILVVTGPTVIGPLLRQIRPQGESGTILKWEGILIDPVGAVLAVLVFETILGGDFGQVPSVILWGVIQTIIIGLVLGLLGAGLIVLLMRYFWVPDQLQNGMSLLFAIGLFTLSNELHPEAGLLTVTVMGVALANQNWVSVRHIVEFKENLRVLLIGTLFILLAARLQLDDILSLGWQGIAFVAVLVVLARPLSVWLSTLGSGLKRGEILFLSWMAPRGIVAASVASIFAFELHEAGHEGADKLVSITFLVIVITVALYGLTAGILARKFNISEQNPQGILFVGANKVVRQMASVVQAMGFRTMLLDTNSFNTRTATDEGLIAHHGNAIDEEVWDELDMTGIGRVLSMTSNNEVNALASLHYHEHFGRAEAYQLPISKKGQGHGLTPSHFLGRFLFSEKINFDFLTDQINKGGSFQTFDLTETFNYEMLKAKFDNKAIPLFLVTAQKQLQIFTTDWQPVPKAGQKVMMLVPAGAEVKSGKGSVKEMPAISPT